MDELTYQSRLIPREEAQRTGCFTSLPIRIHPRNDIADAATAKFIAEWAKHFHDGREKRARFCPSPVGNWNSLLYPEAMPERLGAVSYLLDLGLIHNDLNEELSVQDSKTAHEHMKPALDPQDIRKWDPNSPQMKFKMLLSECVVECIKIDRELGISMLKAFRVLWLDVAENASSEEPQTLDDYWRVRRSNGGLSVFWPIVLFVTNLHLSEDQHALVQPIIVAAEETQCWANDYFSYEREAWEFETGKAKCIVNLVGMLSRTKGLSSTDAKAEVKGMILEAEAKYCRLRDDLYIGLSISGNHYWLSGCSGQNTGKTNGIRNDTKSEGSELIAALNLWFKVPPGALGHINSAIDMLHNASLILDDIQDNLPLRRGVPAAHVVFGAAQSINSATFMFVNATAVVISKLCPAALKALLEGLETLFLGQSWDLYWKHNLQCPSEAEYVRMVDHKTGGMFIMLVRLIMAESPYCGSEVVEDLETLMRLLGRFYQIRDDYLNFSAYASQKGFAEDLDEGKFSFPIVCGIEKHPESRGQILAVFRQRPASAAAEAKSLSRKVKEYMIKCIVSSGGFDETLKCLTSMEHEIELGMVKIEERSGQANSL
ncbi:isoprenoid synthase domain-containing protein [Fusarium oxysporum II5]|nr:uncharacterized protein FOIG_15109 [Fusarium odoratissimum NRRL 54006]EXL91788.1 hypothetical protein FOIG_15109 [Fusarium odoratissimum NRRL 54006]KAK2137909.1 isoprenoid synthase domain-containing protein [Fusarium oxysporum II5]